MPPGPARSARGRRGVVAAASLVALAGCAGGATVRTPGLGVDVSLPPVATPVPVLGVTVDDSAPSATTTYALRLVDSNAHTVASLQPSRRSDDAPAPSCRVARLPVASASAHRVFFLDGDHLLRFVDPDGTSGKIRTLDGLAGGEVTFAVSPDETRMALMSVAPTTAGFHEEVTVETLGGAGAVTIFTRDASGTGSAGDISWPIGWQGDQLVFADAPASPSGSCDAVPAPTGYDLVDPVSGEARLHFCFSTADAGPTGPPSRAGVFCAGHSDSARSETVANVEAWNGTATTFAASGCLVSGLLAPNGDVAATLQVPGPSGCAAATGHVELLARGGAVTVSAAVGTPLGWLDSTHLLAGGGGVLTVVDTATGTVHRGPGGGTLVTALPPEV